MTAMLIHGVDVNDDKEKITRKYDEKQTKYSSFWKTPNKNLISYFSGTH